MSRSSDRQSSTKKTRQRPCKACHGVCHDENGMSYRGMNELNGAAIMLMRESLARVGIEAAFADDVAHNAAAYIFQLRAAIEEVIREDSGLMVVPRLRELLATFTPKRVEVTHV